MQLQFISFFLIHRQPPISTLFPTRRSSDLTFLKAHFYMNSTRRTETDRSISLFQEAIALDPKYAMAYAGLSEDRKSTRLNSSHVEISYAVFCLKKKIMQVVRSKAWRRILLH